MRTNKKPQKKANNNIQKVSDCLYFSERFSEVIKKHNSSEYGRDSFPVVLFPSDINNIARELIKMQEVKNTVDIGGVGGSLPLAVEFGYKQCEKGNNIQVALLEWKKLKDNDH